MSKLKGELAKVQVNVVAQKPLLEGVNLSVLKLSGKQAQILQKQEGQEEVLMQMQSAVDDIFAKIKTGTNGGSGSGVGGLSDELINFLKREFAQVQSKVG